MSEILREYNEYFASGRSLDENAAPVLLDAMIEARDEDVLRELFIAWNLKGISSDDIFYLASLLRARCTRVRSRHELVVDIVGTGGSSGKTFNVSTAAAFVVAGAGIPVAKHGNRAATSSTGSADVLSELGIEPAVDAEAAERCLDDIGICFMYAPNYHRLSPTLGKVRRGLGFPTVFNCVGPLCNPAGAEFQLIGVWDRDVQQHMAAALAKLGTGRTWLVHGSPNLDEISVMGPTYVTEVTENTVDTLEFEPAHFGSRMHNITEFRADSPETSARIILVALNPGEPSSPARTIVELNAAAAIFISGKAESLPHARKIAEESILSGAAIGKLKGLSEACR